MKPNNLILARVALLFKKFFVSTFHQTWSDRTSCEYETIHKETSLQGKS